SEPPPVVLTRRQGQQAVRAYVLDAGGATLGRSQDSDVVLPDDTVSRRHCRIAWSDGVYYLEDLGSSNGTNVNGAKVRSAPLRHGDLIELGSQVLEFIEPTATLGH